MLRTVLVFAPRLVEARTTPFQRSAGLKRCNSPRGFREDIFAEMCTTVRIRACGKGLQPGGSENARLTYGCRLHLVWAQIALALTIRAVEPRRRVRRHNSAAFALSPRQ